MKVGSVIRRCFEVGDDWVARCCRYRMYYRFLGVVRIFNFYKKVIKGRFLSFLRDGYIVLGRVWDSEVVKERFGY